jgi:hypothetical protein
VALQIISFWIRGVQRPHLCRRGSLGRQLKPVLRTLGASTRGTRQYGGPSEKWLESCESVSSRSSRLLWFHAIWCSLNDLVRGGDTSGSWSVVEALRTKSKLKSPFSSTTAAQEVDNNCVLRRAGGKKKEEIRVN